MRFHAGTSGYSYPKWKGGFYPAKLPQSEMLGYYAERLAAVEINSSFYRMPSAQVLQDWAEQVSARFRFAFKTPQTITHRKRLKDAGEATQQFLEVTATLGRRRGPLLFQLPPNMKKDLSRLEPFLASLGSTARAAFEFRHASWFDEDVYDCLRAHRCALCVADTEDFTCPTISTANWGYTRLRRAAYSDKDLRKWLKELRSRNWKECFVFFKHEDTGTGPKFAARFLELAAAG